MIIGKYKYFISMQRVITESEEHECWAFLSTEGDYHLAYITMDGSGAAYMSDIPTPKEKINFAPSGEIRVFEAPFQMTLGNKIRR